jgi:hypothetical protein
VRVGIAVPRTVNTPTAQPPELSHALERSSEGIIELIRLGVARGGSIPAAAWQNFPIDLVHFLSYFRRSRGASSWTALHVSAPVGTSPADRSHGRAMAAEEAVARVG